MAVLSVLNDSSDAASAMQYSAASIYNRFLVLECRVHSPLVKCKLITCSRVQLDEVNMD